MLGVDPILDQSNHDDRQNRDSQQGEIPKSGVQQCMHHRKTSFVFMSMTTSNRVWFSFAHGIESTPKGVPLEQEAPSP